MRTLIAGAAGMGAATALWSKLPLWVKFPVLIALGILAVSELNKDSNESWFANSIYGGQGAQGAAQIVDPKKTEADMKAGKPVTGAAATTAMQVEGLAADAVQKGVTADAMTESEEELLAKQKRRVKLTSTEALRLKEIQIKRQELAKLKADTETAELQAQANAAWQPFNLRLAHQLATGSAPGDLFQYFYDSATRR
jgi:hypothetical protein